MKKENEDIRALIEEKGLMHWQVACQVGVDNSTFSKWLRIRLNDERRARTLKAIEELTSA